jgi:4-hydroxy-tetrahydrodipicolinate synthase
MDGVISVAANCFPKDFSAMVQAALNNNYHLARSLNNRLMQGYDLLFAENNPAGVKAFLSELGIIQNHLRMPLVTLSEAIHAEVKTFIKTLHEKGMHV